MKTFNYWAVLVNRDRTEGRGPTTETEYLFEKKEDACFFVQTAFYAKNFGVQGCVGDMYDVREVVVAIYSSLEETNIDFSEDYSKIMEQKKKAALAKLSFEDKKALGLV